MWILGLKGLIQPLTKMLSARDGDTCNETKLNWTVSCFFQYYTCDPTDFTGKKSVALMRRSE